MKVRSTTVLAVSYKGSLVFASDGQVTLGDQSIVKHSACKIRKLQDGKVLVGFAGSTADAFTLFERFEGKLKEYSGQLGRAAVELAKDWRMDRALRRLESVMIVGDLSAMFLVSGSGDVIEPDDGVLAIGSGGNFALAAARGILASGASDLTARKIVEDSMKIASEICPFTNDKFVIEELNSE